MRCVFRNLTRLVLKCICVVEGAHSVNNQSLSQTGHDIGIISCDT